MKFKLQLIFFLLPCITHAMQQPLPPLLNAAQNGRLSHIIEFIRQGHDVNQIDEQYRANALLWALQHRQPHVALYLIRESTININATNILGSSALILSSAQYLPKITDALLEREDCDVTIENKGGRTVLDFEAIDTFSDGARLKKILARGGPHFTQKWGKSVIALLQKVQKTPWNDPQTRCYDPLHDVSSATYGILNCPNCQTINRNIEMKLKLADEIKESIKYKIM
jgi:hypothetical protein